MDTTKTAIATIKAEDNFINVKCKTEFMREMVNVLKIFHHWRHIAIDDNEELSLDIITSLVEFFEKRLFFSVNQVAILEKIYWKFKLHKLEFDYFNSVDDVDGEDLVRFHEFFNTYKINDYPKQRRCGLITMDKRNLYTGFNGAKKY